MLQRLILGLDGGGTKTVCVALDAATEPPATPDAAAFIPILGRAQSASTNWNSVGVDAAHAAFDAAVRQTVAAAGGALPDVAGICVGMSGVDRPADRARVQEWLHRLMPATPALIYNDAVAALASGTGGVLFGVVVVSGTGMIALGYNRAGARSRAGGWGALLGDGGSGYALGAAILRAVAWAADGRGPQTALLPAVLALLDLDDTDALIRWAYDEFAWHRFARLAPLAVTCAAQGDAVAQAILAQGADDLDIAIETVAHNLGLGADAFPLVAAGGNLRPGLLCDLLAARLRHTLPAARLVHPVVDPAVGAALLACHAHRGAAA
jgi:N-acetylglucosamine kinase-like BadF-type ATPase